MREETQFFEVNEFMGTRVNTVGINLNYSADDYIKYWSQESLKEMICHMVMKHFNELVQIHNYASGSVQGYVNVRVTMNVLAPETNVRRLTWYDRDDRIKAAEQLQKMIAAGSKEGEEDVLGND